MTITATQVKELREKTGVGMMECKKALSESGGDMEKAIVYLRERGMSRAQKKAGRVTSEGTVTVLVNGAQDAGVLLEVNCETDFVSKNAEFQSFVAESAKVALDKKIDDVSALSEMNLPSGNTVQNTLTELIAKIGENMQLRRLRYVKANAGIVATYSHMGGKIGTLVALKCANSPEMQTLAKDIAMHIAAASPRYLKPEEVAADELEQEKAIARKRLLEEGKPENMIEKIMMGQLKKFYSEVCLLEQPFVKDPKVSITQLLAKAGKDVSIQEFTRYQLGEGIEKKSDDFASEVQKLTQM